jgi:hypothetical protein
MFGMPIASERQMRINSAAHWNLLAAAVLLTLAASGCAVSETLDFPDAAGSGSGGSSGSGPGGTGPGSGGGGGTGGMATTGEGGITGSGGIVGGGGFGMGGSGTGGSGRGGTTGTGGIIGTGGITGTGGTAGRGGSTGTGGSGSGGAGGSAPTFTQIYNNILVVYCSGSSCHNPGSQQGVSFASQAGAYTAVKSRVTAGNGAGSSFYMTVNSGSMPPGGPKLSAANLALINAWIDAGALNN